MLKMQTIIIYIYYVSIDSITELKDDRKAGSKKNAERSYFTEVYRLSI